MLETHRTDLEIITTLRLMRHGGTIEEIHDKMAIDRLRPLSVDSIRRHMPGLIKLGSVARSSAIREDRPVLIFLDKSGECVSDAENA